MDIVPGKQIENLSIGLSGGSTRQKIALLKDGDVQSADCINRLFPIGEWTIGIASKSTAFSQRFYGFCFRFFMTSCISDRAKLYYVFYPESSRHLDRWSHTASGAAKIPRISATSGLQRLTRSAII